MILYTAGCKFVPLSQPGGAESSTVPRGEGYLKAAGEELVMRIDREAPQELLVTVTNRSDHAVFLPYDPGSLPGDFAVYVGFVTEKLNVATGRYEALGGTHLGPRTHALNPKTSFTYRYPLSGKGTYRLKLGYAVDKNLSDRLSGIAFIDSVDAMSEEIDEAQRLIQEYCGVLVSEPIEIH